MTNLLSTLKSIINILGETILKIDNRYENDLWITFLFGSIKNIQKFFYNYDSSLKIQTLMPKTP